MKRKFINVKKLISLISAALLLTLLLIAGAICVFANDAHTHNDITFTEWTSTTKLPTSAGSYYLTEDVKLTTDCFISSAVDIDLNGKKIDLGGYHIEVTGGALSIYDCGDTVHKYTPDSNGQWILDEENGTQSTTGGIIYNGNLGAVYLDGGSLNIYGGNFVGNSSVYGGGAFYAYRNVTVNINDANFMGNYAPHHGGAIYIGNYCEATISNANISYNVVGSHGGGLYVSSDSNVTVRDTDISHNKVGSYGGGAYLEGDSEFTFNKVNITENTASSGAGICNKGTLALEEVTISDNIARYGGGGMYMYNSCSVKMTDVSVTENHAAGRGAGINCESSSIELNGVINISNNELSYTVDNNLEIVFVDENKIPDISVGPLGLSEESCVGITINNIYLDELPLVVADQSQKDVSGCFFADEIDYDIQNGEENNVLFVSHTHEFTDGKCSCGAHKHSDTYRVFIPLYKTDKLPSLQGNYYLTEDVTLTEDWVVSSRIDLDLNGKKIDLAGHSIIVKAASTLLLYDCGTEIRTYTPDAYGKWVLDEESGTETTVGGIIYGGEDGAIKMQSTDQGTSGCHIYGGNIVGNSSEANGAGVYVEGRFNMFGGNIVGNSASLSGGGIYLSESGSAAIVGGEISNNTAVLSGGGVCDQGRLDIGGTAKITKNKLTDGNTNNIYLPSGKTVTLNADGLAGGFENGASFGISTEFLPVAPNTIVCSASGSATDLSKYFKSDNLDYETQNGENNAIVLALHVHNYNIPNYDAKQHWDECRCGKTINNAKHIFVFNGTEFRCSVCTSPVVLQGEGTEGRPYLISCEAEIYTALASARGPIYLKLTENLSVAAFGVQTFEIWQDLYIDLNGNTIDMDASSIAPRSGVTLNIRNGKIVSSQNSSSPIILVTGTAKAVIDNLTVECSNYFITHQGSETNTVSNSTVLTSNKNGAFGIWSGRTELSEVEITNTNTEGIIASVEIGAVLVLDRAQTNYDLIGKTYTPHDHEFGLMYIADADGHWHPCNYCRIVVGKSEHTLPEDDGDCTTESKCSTCEFVAAEAQSAHDFSGAYLKDANNHWHKCKNCDVTEPSEAHSGGNATCKDKAVCSVCGAKYGEIGTHIYGDDTVCDTCGHDTAPATTAAATTEAPATEVKIDSGGNENGGCSSSLSAGVAFVMISLTVGTAWTAKKKY